MSTNKNESDAPLPTSATPSQEEETEHKAHYSDGLTEVEAEEIRRLSERFRERDLAAMNKAAPVVAASMAIWERDEEEILSFLSSKAGDAPPSTDDNDLTEEEAERIRHSNENFQARYHAAQNQAAAVVAESMAIWERDEEKILAFLSGDMTDALAAPEDENLAEEEAEEIRRLSERFRELDLAAQNNDATIVAESMAIWERDEEKILEFLKNASRNDKPTR